MTPPSPGSSGRRREQEHSRDGRRPKRPSPDAGCGLIELFHGEPRNREDRTAAVALGWSKTPHHGAREGRKEGMAEMDPVASSVAILAVFVSAWAKGRTESLEAVAWGRAGVWFATGIAGVSVLAGWTLSSITEADPEWILSVEWNWRSIAQWSWIAACVSTLWFAVRMWIYPKQYGEWGSPPERYVNKVWEVVESGTQEQLAAVTKKVEKDIRRIVDWAKDDSRGAYRRWKWEQDANGCVQIVEGEVTDEAKYRRGKVASALLDLMGDERWAKEIVQQGGRLARKTMEEVRMQEAWNVPVGRMLARVTAQAIEQENSFLVNESGYEGGSAALVWHRPTTKALWGQRQALEVDDGGWIEPPLMTSRRWGGVETERWMIVAEEAVKTWASSDWTGSGFFLRRIAGALGSIAMNENRRGDGKKGKDAEDAAWMRARRIKKIVEATMGANEAQAAMFGEVLAEEALKAVADAARLEGGINIWHRQHWVWMEVTWGETFIEGTAHAKLAEEVCRKVWRQCREFMDLGWPGRGPVLNMLLRTRAGWHEEKRDIKARAGRTERALMKGIERMVKHRYYRLREKKPRSAEAMLSEDIRVEGDELVIDQLRPTWPREKALEPVRWKLR